MSKSGKTYSTVPVAASTMQIVADVQAQAGIAQGFLTTHWSVVLAAGTGDPARASAALETLCRAYWPPIYGFIRRRGHGPHEAEDLTQEFFHRLLEENPFASVEPERGRFRSFLLTRLKHFLNDEYKRANAQKRGGGRIPISIEDEEAGLAGSLSLAIQATPEHEYERRWAVALLERALAQLQRESEAAGKRELFERLKPFLEGAARYGDSTRVAGQLGVTPNVVAVSMHRLRVRYRELVREEIANTVTSPSQIEEELRHLVAVLSRGPS